MTPWIGGWRFLGGGILLLSGSPEHLSLTPMPTQAATKLVCSSINHDYSFCRVETRHDVRTVEQLAPALCIEDRTWGIDRNGIWADRGCSARFPMNSGGSSTGSVMGALVDGGGAGTLLSDQGSRGDRADTGSPELNLRVVVSPEARRQLAAKAEGITVAADVYGDPSAEGREHADEIGRVLVLRRQFSLPAEGGTTTIERGAIAEDRRRWLAGPMKINVNVYSSRKSSPDNVLACDFMDGPLPESRQPVVFNCSLLTEGKQPKRVT